MTFCRMLTPALALLVGLGSQAEVMMLESHAARIVSDRSNYHRTRDLISQCDAALDRWLPPLPATPRRWITVLVVDSRQPPPKIAPLGPQIVIDLDASVAQATATVALALASRRLLADGWQPETAERFRWLAAATTFELLNIRLPGRNRRLEIAPALNTIRAGATPTPATLAACPVDPKWPESFTLYAAHCHLACDILAASHPQAADTPLAAFIAQLVAGQAPATAWATVAPRFAPDLDPASGDWYASRLRQLATTTTRNAWDDELANRLEEILTVRVIAPDDNGVMRPLKVPLSRLRDHFPAYHLSPEAIVRKERELFELFKEAPLLLQPPLNSYLAAFQGHRRGDRWNRFASQLELADRQLATAVHRHRGSLTLLDQAESTHLDPLARLAPLLAIAAEHQAARHALDPEAAAWLDQQP